MLKETKRRFIFVTMSILFLVFAVIFGARWIAARNDASTEIQISLMDLERQYASPDNPPPDSEEGKAGIRSLRIKEYFIVIVKDGNDYVKERSDKVTDEEVEKITEEAVKNGFRSGSAGDYYYKKTVIGEETVITAFNAETVLSSYRSAVFRFFLLIISSYIVLGIVVYFSAGKVFEPVRSTFYKQKQFISDASHELKTPVAIISANADVLIGQNDNAYVRSIKKQVERINDLLGDLLLLARMDEGKEKRTKEKFCVSEDLTEIVLSFEALAYEKGKTIDCRIEKEVFYDGDREGIKRIAGILLDNAVKYAENDSAITVTLKKNGSRIFFSVFNKGSDVPDADSQKVFERFYRGDSSRSRETGGSGLGLSIAKGIALSNKWNIYADSKQGESMEISLTI